MKIFVSWSGELSCKIAEVLKKWLPCIIQSIEVFFSREDIEKGDNWDKTISKELSDCKYGIICLTHDNINAPWVNFEAGAIAKTLDSRVAALMINIKPSDIRGPLSRYQATKFEKDDFYQLILSINKTLETPLDDMILRNTFDAMWESLEQEANSIISAFASKSNGKKDDNDLKEIENAPIEEILQLLRKQSSILSSPENLIPIEYMEYIQTKVFEKNRRFYMENDMFLEEIIHYFHLIMPHLKTCLLKCQGLIEKLNLEELLNILKHYAKRKGNKRMYLEFRSLESELHQYMIAETIEGLNKNEKESK